jgi:outer membrane lipoprotein carrier protein
MNHRLLFSILFSFTLVNAFAQYDPKAKVTLDEMSKRYSSMSGFKATFSYTMTNPTANIKESNTGEITVKGSKYYLKMSAQEIWFNGTTVWTYIKSSNEVNISDYDPSEDEITPTKIYNMYKTGYKYMLVEEKTDPNKGVYQVIDLIPENRNQQFHKVRLEVFKSNYSLRSWKIFEKNGTIYEYAVKTYTPNIQVADASFTFDAAKYPGVESVDLR